MPKCLNCNKEVKPGEWRCSTGERHIVESKRYYMDDACADPGPYVNGVPTGENRKHSQTTIANIVPEKRYMNGNEQVIEPGINVTFHRGVYETQMADEQYFLDRKPGLCSKERWNEVYLTNNEKMEIREMELNAKHARIEQERNELLAMVQAQAKGQQKSA